MNNPRFVLVDEQGRFLATFGRDAPDCADIARAADGLQGLGVGGWVGLASGSFIGARRPVVRPWATLGRPVGSFASAIYAAGGVCCGCMPWEIG